MCRRGCLENQSWLIMSYSFLNEFLFNLKTRGKGRRRVSGKNICPQASIGVFWLQMSPEARNIIPTV